MGFAYLAVVALVVGTASAAPLAVALGTDGADANSASAASTRATSAANTTSAAAAGRAPAPPSAAPSASSAGVASPSTAVASPRSTVVAPAAASNKALAHATSVRDMENVVHAVIRAQRGFRRFYATLEARRRRCLRAMRCLCRLLALLLLRLLLRRDHVGGGDHVLQRAGLGGAVRGYRE